MAGDWLPPQPSGGSPPQPPPEYPQRRPQQGYSQYGYPPQPPNNEAVAGFTCGIVGASLLFVTAGLSSVLSLILGVVAIPYSRRGKRNVAEGRTSKHASLASAAYVIGIVTVVLSVIATVLWVLVLIVLANEPWWIDPEDNRFDDQFDFQVVLRTAALAARLVG